MKKLIRKFIKRNTAAVLAQFHDMIDELEAVATFADIKAAKAQAKAEALVDKAMAHAEEVARARKAADKIKAVFHV